MRIIDEFYSSLMEYNDLKAESLFNEYHLGIGSINFRERINKWIPFLKKDLFLGYLFSEKSKEIYIEKSDMKYAIKTGLVQFLKDNYENYKVKMVSSRDKYGLSHVFIRKFRELKG